MSTGPHFTRKVSQSEGRADNPRGKTDATVRNVVPIPRTTRDTDDIADRYPSKPLVLAIDPCPTKAYRALIPPTLAYWGNHARERFIPWIRF